MTCRCWPIDKGVDRSQSRSFRPAGGLPSLRDYMIAQTRVVLVILGLPNSNSKSNASDGFGKCLLIIILGMQIEQQILLPFILAFATKIFPLETRPFFPSSRLSSLIICIYRYGFFYFAFTPFLLSYFVCVRPWMTEDRVS